MAYDELKNKLSIGGEDVIDVINSVADANILKETSQYADVSNYVTTTGHVASANTANSAVNLTGNIIAAQTQGATSTASAKIN